MIRKHKISIRFLPRYFEPRKDGSIHIEATVTTGGKREKIPTRVFVFAPHWDKKKQRIKNTAPYADASNMELNRFELALLTLHENMTRLGNVPTRQDFNRALGIANPTEAAADFVDFCRKWLLTRKDLALGTVNQLNSEINKLEAWKTPFTFADLTKKTMTEYHAHLTELGNNPNTIQKSMKKIRMFLNAAVQQEIIPTNPLDGITYKGVSPTVIESLMDAEITKLEGYTGKREKTAKLFLLQCYTGFAHADLETLRPEHIYEDKGHHWISKGRKKTDVNALIPVFPKTRALLEYFDFDYNGQLPVVVQQKYNKYLKEIATELNIKTPLSSHVGRKTAGMVLLDNGVPLETVSRILGHKSVATTQKWYAKIRAGRIAKDTATFTAFG